MENRSWNGKERNKNLYMLNIAINKSLYAKCSNKYGKSCVTYVEMWKNVVSGYGYFLFYKIL